jgi:hypothetical protein
VYANALDWCVLKDGGDADAVILYRPPQNVGQLRVRGPTHTRLNAGFV